MPYIREYEDTIKHRQVGRYEKQDYENNATCLQKPSQNFENACPAPADLVPQISRSSVAQLFLYIYFSFYWGVELRENHQMDSKRLVSTLSDSTPL